MIFIVDFTVVLQVLLIRFVGCLGNEVLVWNGRI